MKTVLFFLIALFSAPIFASPALDISPLLKSPKNYQRWDELLAHLDRPSKLKVLGYSAASGATLGALGGVKSNAVATVVDQAPARPGDFSLRQDSQALDSLYGAAAGAALGGLLGVSHIVFADSDASDALREDPKNPYSLRRHLIRLVPKIRAQGFTLALNASF